MKPQTITRPWGSMRQFTQNETSTVKIITVNPGEALSLQTHAKRSEYWYIISGTPTITIGENTIKAHPGNEFVAEEKVSHRIENTSQDEIVSLLEISTGEFDEGDITRLDDKYGRA